MTPSNVLETRLAPFVPTTPRSQRPRCLIMGVLNITPDSFSDGGLHLDPASALSAARQMVNDGADLLDLGAESTRPGSTPVPPLKQWERLEPVIRLLSEALPGVPLTIDTTSAEVARRGLALGAAGINDISAGLHDSDILRTTADAGAVYIAMHMQGTPQTMQQRPRYPRSGVVSEVTEFLEERLAAARHAGIAPARLVADPGIGFGKTDAHNLQLLRDLRPIGDRLGVPLLVGTSRKGFLGRLTGRDRPTDRLAATAASVAWAVAEGAAVVRVHDVRDMRDVAAVVHAIQTAPEPGPDT